MSMYVKYAKYAKYAKYVFLYNANNMPKYAIKIIQEICKYMQKYADGNMHKYSKICDREYA